MESRKEFRCEWPVIAPQNEQFFGPLIPGDGGLAIYVSHTTGLR
jgi:hypothetical protein